MHIIKVVHIMQVMHIMQAIKVMHVFQVLHVMQVTQVMKDICVGFVSKLCRWLTTIFGIFPLSLSFLFLTTIAKMA